MKDLRRQALESGKTVSRKAQSKMSSRASSATPSRTNSGTVSRHGSDDEEGNLSDGTNWSVASIDDMIMGEPDDVADAWRQELADCIENIVDRKRKGVEDREAALAIFNHMLMSRYAFDEIDKKTFELIPALLKSVKNETSEKETSLALRAIALTLITAPNGKAYEQVLPVLQRSYRTSESHVVKAAAIHALGAAQVFCGASDGETEEFMDELLEIIESDGNAVSAVDSADVVTAACEEWGFLATYLDDLSEKTEEAMDAFVEQLDSTDTAVQVAAGENIALLYEKSFTEREADDEPASDEEDEEGNPVDHSMVKRYDVYRQANQLKHQLSKLANESSRHIAKKHRKTLHVNFTDILNTVEHPTRGPRYQNAIDQETGRSYGSRLTVRIHKTGFMRIDKWWKLHRLQALRRLLGGGFLVHYQHNNVIFEDVLPIMIQAD